MKQKINNALGELDDRLIQEAAQAKRLESNAPKILKWVLIPAGAAAAAGLCVFALTNRPDGGVDLTTPSSESSIPAVVIPAVDNKTNLGDILPDTMELHSPSREYAEELIFGSEFPALIYADDNRIVFTDIGRCVYIYDRNAAKITYSANVYEALENTVGENISDFQHDGWNGIGFSAAVNGEEVLLTVSFYYAADETYLKYTLDTGSGVLRRYDELEEGYTEYLPERSADFGGGDVTDIVLLSDSEYVGIAIGQDGFVLRGVELRQYAVSDGRIEVTNTAKPFDDEYFDSLEMENGDLGVYKLSDYAALRFDTASGTFTMTGWNENDELLSGCYTVSGSDLILQCSDGKEYQFLISGGSVTAVTGEQEAELGRYIWEDGVPPVNKLMFQYSYGAEVEESTAGNISYSQQDEDENNRTIAMTIRDYYGQNGTSISPDEAGKLIESMSYPLDDLHTTVTTFNGYNEWRGGNHYGIDIGDKEIAGANIYAPLDGTVIKAAGEGWNGGMGSYIIIDHGSGLSTVYAHCREVNVTSGQRVSQGEVIGTVGKSGWSTGNHLHFEIRENGEVLSEDMDKFVGMYGLTNQSTNSDIIKQNYTKSIYDPTTAPQVIKSLTCPVAEELNQYTETPGSYIGHAGIDFCAADIYGQDIYAAQSGEVVLAEWYYGYGYCVMIDHGSGVLTVYAHCSELDVAAGQTVEQGEVIGKVGRTGQTTGDLLHFEIRVDNTADYDAMNGFIERIGSVRSPLAGKIME